MFEIDVRGLREIQVAFEQVGRKLADGSLVMRAAMVIERQAKINATGRPGPKVQTGRLRASITPEKLDNNTARVGTNVFYAPFVEFGHSQNPGQFVPPLKKRLVANHAPAYPFLGPTLNQCKSELGNVVATFGHELGSEWGK